VLGKVRGPRSSAALLLYRRQVALEHREVALLRLRAAGSGEQQQQRWAEAAGRYTGVHISPQISGQLIDAAIDVPPRVVTVRGGGATAPS
jgi:hypothetical protein